MTVSTLPWVHYSKAFLYVLRSTYTPRRGWTPMKTPPICRPTTAKEPEDPAVPGVEEGRTEVGRGRENERGRKGGRIREWESRDE